MFINISSSEGSHAHHFWVERNIQFCQEQNGLVKCPNTNKNTCLLETMLSMEVAVSHLFGYQGRLFPDGSFR